MSGVDHLGTSVPDEEVWEESQHDGLLTRHDGTMRWYLCKGVGCGYTNNRLYHCKMHWERIHVRGGNPMSKKRKFVAVQESPSSRESSSRHAKAADKKSKHAQQTSLSSRASANQYQPKALLHDDGFPSRTAPRSSSSASASPSTHKYEPAAEHVLKTPTQLPPSQKRASSGPQRTPDVPKVTAPMLEESFAVAKRLDASHFTQESAKILYFGGGVFSFSDSGMYLHAADLRSSSTSSKNSSPLHKKPFIVAMSPDLPSTPKPRKRAPPVLPSIPLSPIPHMNRKEENILSPERKGGTLSHNSGLVFSCINTPENSPTRPLKNMAPVTPILDQQMSGRFSLATTPKGFLTRALQSPLLSRAFQSPSSFFLAPESTTSTSLSGTWSSRAMKPNSADSLLCTEAMNLDFEGIMDEKVSDRAIVLSVYLLLLCVHLCGLCIQKTHCTNKSACADERTIPAIFFQCSSDQPWCDSSPCFALRFKLCCLYCMRRVCRSILDCQWTPCRTIARGRGH